MFNSKKFLLIVYVCVFPYPKTVLSNPVVGVYSLGSHIFKLGMALLLKSVCSFRAEVVVDCCDVFLVLLLKYVCSFCAEVLAEYCDFFLFK